VAVALSPDGRAAVTGSQDNTARLWDATAGRPLGPSLAHRGEVAVLAFSPDGATVLTASGTARLSSFTTATSDAARLALWVEVVTGLEARDDGAVRLLDVSAWEQRRQRLRDDGPPVPHRPALLSYLRSPARGDDGPFGRSFLSARPPR
jgi:hypothetical protein